MQRGIQLFIFENHRFKDKKLKRDKLKASSDILASKTRLKFLRFLYFHEFFQKSSNIIEHEFTFLFCNIMRSHCIWGKTGLC